MANKRQSRKKLKKHNELRGIVRGLGNNGCDKLEIMENSDGSLWVYSAKGCVTDIQGTLSVECLTGILHEALFTSAFDINILESKYGGNKMGEQGNWLETTLKDLGATIPKKDVQDATEKLVEGYGINVTDLTGKTWGIINKQGQVLACGIEPEIKWLAKYLEGSEYTYKEVTDNKVVAESEEKLAITDGYGRETVADLLIASYTTTDAEAQESLTGLVKLLNSFLPESEYFTLKKDLYTEEDVANLY